MIPGIEPASSASIRVRSTEPISQWPMPAIKVSGTAWAMSLPAMRATGSLWIEDQERGRSERAGADRRDRNQHAEDRSEKDGPVRHTARFHRIDMVAAPSAGSTAGKRRQRW